MENMFNLISNLGAKRDDYGVSDLLAQVSKRSGSISAEDREEINAMSRRLRQLRTGEHTPRQTPENSNHGMTNTKKGFGKDMLKKDDLLRGFANLLNSPAKRNHEETPVSPPTSPDRPESCDSGPVMMRDFDSPSSSPDSSEKADDDLCAFGTDQKL
jgi:hypothetical protein